MSWRLTPRVRPPTSSEGRHGDACCRYAAVMFISLLSSLHLRLQCPSLPFFPSAFPYTAFSHPSFFIFLFASSPPSFLPPRSPRFLLSILSSSYFHLLHLSSLLSLLLSVSFHPYSLSRVLNASLLPLFFPFLSPCHLISFLSSHLPISYHPSFSPSMLLLTSFI